MLLLDTHALVWLVQDDRRLGRRAKGRIAGASPGSITVSTLSWYEMGCLVQRGRIRLSQNLASQRQSLLEGGMVEQPVSATIAMDALDLAGLPRDPMDRFIVATARIIGAVLVTSDERILEWPGELERLDAQS
jgi:PIN domain nuclease of toxin-antitoxin system